MGATEQRFSGGDVCVTREETSMELFGERTTEEMEGGLNDEIGGS